MPRLSIIIISFNTKELTHKCLSALVQALHSKNNSRNDYEIILVDNASPDDSLAMLQEFTKQYSSHHIEFKLIENKENQGFGKANNQGLAIAKGEYILYFNSDVLVDSTIDFPALMDYLDKDKSRAALTVRLELSTGSIDQASHRGFPTLWRSFCYYAGLERTLGKIPSLRKLFGGYHMLDKDLSTIHEIDSPSGAFFLVKKDVVDKIHGFDELFFMYGEDLDMSYQIKELGYQIFYYPEYKALHLKNKSGIRSPNKEIVQKIKFHFYDAMKLFYKKHYEKHHPWIVNQLVYLLIDLKHKLS